MKNYNGEVIVNEDFDKDYYITMPEEQILIDKYGRPYYQTSMGKSMLVKKGGYYYTKD
jgi:hypothetical protein